MQLASAPKSLGHINLSEVAVVGVVKLEDGFLVLGVGRVWNLTAGRNMNSVRKDFSRYMPTMWPSF